MTKSIRLRPLLLTLGLLGFLSHTTLAQQGPATTNDDTTIDRQKTIKAAVIVRNRSGKELDAQQRILEDLIAGEITRLGVSVISRGDVLESVGAYETGRSAAATGGDNLFANNTSALRLAQTLGADYLLTASILSVGSRDRSFSGYGVNTNSVETTLRLNYRIMNGDGTSAVSENIEVTRKESLKDGGVTTSLLQEAAEELGRSLEKQLAQLPEVQERPGFVNVTIQATMQDLSLPDVVRGADGEYAITANRYQLEVTGAEIEVNGLAIGTTSSDTALQVPAGINKLRVSRPGYEDAIRTVNFFEGQRLLVPMQLSGAGLTQMREMTALLQDLKADAKLTDAQISKIEGHAQFLRQSGVRIDYQTNTTEPIQLHQTTNSLFGGTPAAAR